VTFSRPFSKFFTLRFKGVKIFFQYQKPHHVLIIAIQKGLK
jgi:hypothetical protein